MATMELPPMFADLALPSECLDHETKSFRMSNVLGNKSDDLSNRAERHRAEWPKLVMRHRSFVLASVAEVQWTLQLGHNDPPQLYRTNTACVPTAVFSIRHFHVQSDSCDGVPVPSTERSMKYSSTSDLVDLVEVFLSRAIELEAELRSKGSQWAYTPRIRSQSAWEYTGQDDRKLINKGEMLPDGVSRWPAGQTSFFDTVDTEEDYGPEEFGPLAIDEVDYRRACTLQPATHNRVPDPSKINIKVVRATSADLNELRWLLATVNNVEGATIFTQLVERRSKKHFNIVIEGDKPCFEVHKFSLLDPWRVAWKWIERLDVSATILQRAYLAMVGLTWAPVPVAPEASWIYELVVTAPPRGSTEPEATIDVSSASSNDHAASELVKHLIHRGFTEFLWNVVRFWQGISSPLDRQGLATAPNEDLSSMIALNLKRLSSQYTGEGWMSNTVPIGALVAAAWKEIHFKHPSLSYSGNNMRLLLPTRVETTVFTVNPEISDVAKAKGEMFINGYRLIAQGDNKFRLGISSAGLVLSAAFFVKDIADRNKRQRQSWIFDVCRGGAIPSPSLAMLILACHGGNILATYDESYARYFAGMYPFAAVCEYPRSCSYQSLRTKQHRLLFSLIDASDCRGAQLCDLLKSMDKQEGLMYLQCFAHSCVLAPADNWPILLSYMTKPLAVPMRRPLLTSSFPLGWVQMDRIAPGQYFIKDLPAQTNKPDAHDPPLTKTDISKLNFCHQILRPNDIIEVVPHDYGLTHSQTLDVEPIALPPGVTVDVVNVASLKHLQAPSTSLSVRSTATSAGAMESASRHRFPPQRSFVSDDISSTTTAPPNEY